MSKGLQLKIPPKPMKHKMENRCMLRQARKTRKKKNLNFQMKKLMSLTMVQAMT